MSREELEQAWNNLSQTKRRQAKIKRAYQAALNEAAEAEAKGAVNGDADKELEDEEHKSDEDSDSMGNDDDEDEAAKGAANGDAEEMEDEEHKSNNDDDNDDNNDDDDDDELGDEERKSSEDPNEQLEREIFHAKERSRRRKRQRHRATASRLQPRRVAGRCAALNRADGTHCKQRVQPDSLFCAAHVKIEAMEHARQKCRELNGNLKDRCGKDAIPRLERIEATFVPRCKHHFAVFLSKGPYAPLQKKLKRAVSEAKLQHQRNYTALLQEENHARNNAQFLGANQAPQSAADAEAAVDALLAALAENE